jgi:anti-anti-sigma factor
MVPDFSTEVAEVDGATVIYVRGEIDMATAARLRDAIEPHLGPEQSIVLDLCGVRFMDSSCFHVLLQARGTLTVDGGSLVLRNPSRAARNLLDRVQAEQFLQIEADERRADRADNQPEEEI